MGRTINFTNNDSAFQITFFVFGLLVSIVSCISYTLFIQSQFSHNNASRNVRVLNTRLALIVPAYALLFLLIFCFPHHWEFFEVGISFTEGYCIFCFYKMLKFHVGSKEKTVELIVSSDHTAPCCYSCQKNRPHCCYNVIDVCLIQFFTLRPMFFLVCAIAGISSSHSPIIQLFEILTIISLIVAMISLLRIYHFLIHHAEILSPTKKVLFIKGNNKLFYYVIYFPF